MKNLHTESRYNEQNEKRAKNKCESRKMENKCKREQKNGKENETELTLSTYHKAIVQPNCIRNKTITLKKRIKEETNEKEGKEKEKERVKCGVRLH